VSEVPRLAAGLTPPIDLLRRYLFGESGGYMDHCIIPGWEIAYHLGDHYCRPKNVPGGGSTSWSEHAYGKGNALDIGLPDTTEGHRVGDEIDAFVEARPKLFAQSLWRGVPLHYPGHIHVSGNPMGGGATTPECAGGPKCPIVQPLPMSALGVEEDDEMSKEYEDALVNKAIGQANGYGLTKMKANGFKGDALPPGAKALADSPAKYAGFWFALGKCEAAS
jgi:hypothetical protein